MKSNDLSKDNCKKAIMEAAANGNAEQLAASIQNLAECVSAEVRQMFENSHNAEISAEHDSQILTSRGVRQLTSAEQSYYNEVIDAMKSVATGAAEPKQALANVTATMPETVFESVFDELKEEHPLLDMITFMPSTGNIKLIVDASGHSTAVWGELNSAITEEITAGFKVLDTSLAKLTAFIPVNKDMLDLGPQWLDRYVRTLLVEWFANGLEDGIINGDGKGKPIGMIRNVSDTVSVVGGVYPEKVPIKVTDFSKETMGNLVSMLATNGYGKVRKIRDLILICNDQDYYKKVMPATTAVSPDGTYKRDIFPVPLKVIVSSEVAPGRAVLGLAKRYADALGSPKNGKIEYSDHVKFIEDKRVYVIKGYSYGMPCDNNAFLYLDIEDLKPYHYVVETVTPAAPSADATLSALTLGAAALSPVFAAETTTYTAETTNATNALNAVPASGAAEVTATLNGTSVDNGSSLTWEPGSNTVVVTVTAEDGSTTKDYTVTVTKS